MRRLLTFSMLLALTLSGCNRSAPAPMSDTPKGKPSDSTPTTPKLPVAFTPETGSLLSAEEVPLSEQINRENVRILAAAMPAMVRVMANRPVDPHIQIFGKNLPFEFNLKPGTHGIQQNDPSYGSGVVISKDGYVVTNSHVIEDAKDIQVELQDKRSFPARVVASDAAMDVAVLKVDVTDLTALPWGNSDRVQIGEQVFAIGNPFNLDESASKGIVSATGRNLPDSTSAAPRYENFIQTDAAINPGNSGGALINIHGELIGINTAIASFSGGNQGVGFAIPSNLVRYAVEGMLKNGRVVTGYLGVKLPESVDDGVGAFLQLGSLRGALLAGVIPDSPAEQAGLRAGDFITVVDGHRINSLADLRLVVAQIAIGSEVEVDYIRNGAPQTATVKIAEAPKELQANYNPYEKDGNQTVTTTNTGLPANAENVLGGLTVSDLDDKSRQKFGVDSLVTDGVVVSNVEEGSIADSKGIQRGDVIESASVNHRTTSQVKSGKDFTDLSKSLKPDQSVVLLIHHARSSSFIYLTPGK